MIAISEGELKIHPWTGTKPTGSSDAPERKAVRDARVP